MSIQTQFSQSTPIASSSLPRSIAWMGQPGLPFGNYRLKQSTPIELEITADAITLKLMCVGISQSGDSIEEAIENLTWYISDILDDQRKNPNQPLGKALQKQFALLQSIFEYADANH